MNRNTDKKLLEIRRQLIHSLGMFGAPLIIFFGFEIMKVLYGFILIIIVVMNFYRQTKSGKRTFIVKRYYKFEKWAEKQLSKYERGEEFLKGPIMYFLGVFVVMSLFAQEQVIPAILVLAIGDAASTIVGISFGKHKHIWNKSSSWEGTITFFVFAVIILLSFTSLESALLIAGIIALVESLPVIDDNISIPVCVAFLLTVL
jgi:dolichol kinase